MCAFLSRMTNPANKTAFFRVVGTGHHDCGRKEQCPWTTPKLRGNVEMYLSAQAVSNSFYCQIVFDYEIFSTFILSFLIHNISKLQ